MASIYYKTESKPVDGVTYGTFSFFKLDRIPIADRQNIVFINHAHLISDLLQDTMRLSSHFVYSLKELT